MRWHVLDLLQCAKVVILSSSLERDALKGKKEPLFRQTNAVWSTDTHLHGVVNIKAEHFHIRVFSTFVFGQVC